MSNKNNTYELTAVQLCDLIDDAFALGKLYATDELNTCRWVNSSRVPVCDSNEKWEAFIDANGGHNLHSGDAKAEMLFRHLTEVIKEKVTQTFYFD